MNEAGPIEFFTDRERLLWVAAVLLYGVGDTVTTFWGLSTGGVAEAGPIAGPVIDTYGSLGFLALKGATFVLFYAVWAVLETTGRAAVPLALVVVGGGVTGWNVGVIIGAVIT